MLSSPTPLTGITACVVDVMSHDIGMVLVRASDRDVRRGQHAGMTVGMGVVAV
jgi:hypothetical protein